MASMMEKFRETDTNYTIALPQFFESSALVYGQIDFVRLLDTDGIILSNLFNKIFCRSEITSLTFSLAAPGFWFGGWGGGIKG